MGVYNHCECRYKPIFLPDCFCTKMQKHLYMSLNFVLAIFFDFTKAFDCIDKDIMFQKLINKFNFSHSAAKFVYSYLNSRKCVVNIDGSLSSTCDILFGVPQCSIHEDKL